MATHSNILAWRIPWIKDSDGLQSMELQRVGHDWVTNPFNWLLFPNQVTFWGYQWMWIGGHVNLGDTIQPPVPSWTHQAAFQTRGLPLLFSLPGTPMSYPPFSTWLCPLCSGLNVRSSGSPQWPHPPGLSWSAIRFLQDLHPVYWLKCSLRPLSAPPSDCPLGEELLRVKPGPKLLESEAWIFAWSPWTLVPPCLRASVSSASPGKWLTTAGCSLGDHHPLLFACPEGQGHPSQACSDVP